jgi:gamma-glutamyl phosphate reductase
VRSARFGNTREGTSNIQHPTPNIEVVPAKPEDFRTEFLDLILAVKVVDSLEEGDRAHRGEWLAP